jgi:hypothetical protein
VIDASEKKKEMRTDKKKELVEIGCSIFQIDSGDGVVTS